MPFMSMPLSQEDLPAAVREVLPDLLGELSEMVVQRLSQQRPVATDAAEASSEDASSSASTFVPTKPDATSTSATMPPIVADNNGNPTQRDPAGSETAHAAGLSPQGEKSVPPTEEQIAKRQRETPDELAQAAAELCRTRTESEQEVTRLKEEIAGLNSSLTEARGLIEQADKLRQLQEENTHATAELASKSAEFEDYRRAGEKASVLLKLIWPQWMRDDSVAGWRARIESQIFGADATAPLGLLFAALHTYSAAVRDLDPRTLHDALRDVGRRLYAFLRESQSASEIECAQAAEQWAAAINQECAGRGEVEVPVPGNAANSQWMIFQPRGGSSPDVTSVRSWCVRDAQKRPVHRAEVIV